MSNSKRKQNAYQREGGFFKFDRQVYRSAAYSSLTPIQRAALMHLLLHYVPHRSEDIGMSNRRLALEIGINKDTAGKALRRLEEVGFIRLVKESHWIYGKSRIYRLTFMNYQGRVPSDEWNRFQVDGQGRPDKADG